MTSDGLRLLQDLRRSRSTRPASCGHAPPPPASPATPPRMSAPSRNVILKPEQRLRYAPGAGRPGGGPGRIEAAEGGQMAAFVFIHGAGDAGWYWHLVAAELRERGHDTVAPDLPCDDDSAGLPEYADTVAAAAGDRTDLVVVAQSLGGFTAPLVCDRVPVELLILVAPMIPAPGEAPAGYWSGTRYEEEVRERYD